MSDTVATPPTAPFESASELREAHAKLLEALDHELERDASGAAEVAALTRLEPQILNFLARGAATGAYLEETKERTACQVLLDYWLSSLAQTTRQAPAARLAEFDRARLPELDNRRCPYVGLEAFQDKEFFFGRETDTQVLLTQIRDAPLVVVLGASGSGKSSLVMGGVLPALATADVPPALRLLAAVVPGNAPLQHLQSAVVHTSVAADEQGTTWANSAHLISLLGGDEAPHTLITIDQFEELFTLSDPSERERLVANLAALLAAGRGHRVLLTMREEFRSRLMELRALSPYLEKGWYSMRPMGYEELKAAIERPAALVNLQFQAGIVDDLVQKVLGQQAALPLLQFTLRTLWNQRDRNRITWEVYRRVGDPLNALKTSAEAFYDGQPPETQDEITRILLELVRVDELLEAYRQPVQVSQLLRAGKANTEAVLRLLAERDYVRLTRAEDPIAEVKHEALIRNWPRLVGWIDDKRIDRRRRLALTQAGQRWSESGRPSEGLLTGWQLQEAKRQGDLSGWGPSRGPVGGRQPPPAGRGSHGA